MIVFRFLILFILYIFIKKNLDEKTGEDKYYALKKFFNKFFNDGMNFTAMREISILKEMNHENIVKVKM